MAVRSTDELKQSWRSRKTVSCKNFHHMLHLPASTRQMASVDGPPFCWHPRSCATCAAQGSDLGDILAKERTSHAEQGHGPFPGPNPSW